MSDAARPTHTARYYEQPPTCSDPDGTRHWITRGANFVVVATQAQPGAVLARAGVQQHDEYMLLLPEGMPARIETGSADVESAGDSLGIVPPGDSRVTTLGGGWLYRVFSRCSTDLLARAGNAADYADGAPDVAPFEPWPAPSGGYRLRHYRLADHVRGDTTMRLFRSSNLMLNVFLPNQAPRDIRKMTPHSHADFEQGSLAVRGRYVHHVRHPWTPDMTRWRDDAHEEVDSPSLIVIPPKVVHTSQSIGRSGMQLVDIFAPPRDDFSLKPGLVCNAADYPLPERLRTAAAPAAPA